MRTHYIAVELAMVKAGFTAAQAAEFVAMRRVWDPQANAYFVNVTPQLWADSLAFLRSEAGCVR